MKSQNFNPLFRTTQRHRCFFILVIAALASCNCTNATEASGGFARDAAFLAKHTDVVVLTLGQSAVAVVPQYQARVMTSSFDYHAGPSFGWINRPVIETGVHPKSETAGALAEHIHVFGGEERFWLGPEGGQFGLFFKPGTKFEFAHWVTPPAIDTDSFELVEKTKTSARFNHDCELTNHRGTIFSVGIERTITVLAPSELEKILGLKIATEIHVVGFESDNRITNRGASAWKPDTGLLSIWILGMYRPSPQTTVVIPFQAGNDTELGPKVNDTYFGKVPPAYLQIEGNVLFFKGDGSHRGKIGITAQRSTGIAGSYDAEGKVLTLVTYNVQPAPHGFVNSLWEFQENPYGGDVINAYNDGAPAPGEAPLGPFFEIETSSPAAALEPGATMRHVQKTFHLHGSADLLDPIARKALGVGLDKITGAMSPVGQSTPSENSGSSR